MNHSVQSINQSINHSTMNLQALGAFYESKLNERFNRAHVSEIVSGMFVDQKACWDSEKIAVIKNLRAAVSNKANEDAFVDLIDGRDTLGCLSPLGALLVKRVHYSFTRNCEINEDGLLACLDEDDVDVEPWWEQCHRRMWKDFAKLMLEYHLEEDEMCVDEITDDED